MELRTVIYDACVLYPDTLRNLLVHIGRTRLVFARWSNDIHEEWMRNLLRNQPSIKREKLERTRDLMNVSIKDCLVADYESLIPTLTLPDPDDRHVLAAAIHCQAQIIVTFNLKDFPRDSLEPYGIEALSPDDFIANLIDLAGDVACGAAKQHRTSLKRPAMSVDEYLASLERQRLPRTVAKLRANAELL